MTRQIDRCTPSRWSFTAHGSRARRRFVRLVRVRLVRLVRVRLFRVPVPSSRVRLVRASPHPEAGAGAGAGAGVGGGVIHVLLSHDSSFRPWEIEPARDDETKRNETKRDLATTARRQCETRDTGGGIDSVASVIASSIASVIAGRARPRGRPSKSDDGTRSAARGTTGDRRRRRRRRR